MRMVGDDRGDEAWNGSTSGSTDDEATRVFSRDDLASSGEATRAFTRAQDTEPTQEFGRAEPPSDGPAAGEPDKFTRKFVRERPGSRPRPRTREERPPAPPPEPYDDEPYDDGPYDDGPLDEDPEPRPRPRRRKRRRFRLGRIITLILLVALAIPPATWGWVWYTARQDDREASDAIIVLGASQYNGVPSPVFEARLRQAQVLYLDGVAPVIVTVGGKQPDDNFTEAAAGRNWLVDVGVPADHVVAVEEGSDTLQSFQAVSEVYEANEWETAILVSDPWHSLRSKVMASDFGIEAGTSPSRSGPAVIERRTQLWYITRETASLWYYWIFNDSSELRVNAA
ncbi:YdcF family protein [Nocardiopsis sp. NPDC055879]